MVEGLYKKWWCLRDLYEQPPEVCSLPMSTKKKKKTIRIFAIKNKGKKKSTLLIHIRFLPKKTYSKVPESMQKIVFTSKLYFFATPLIKLKLSQQIANHVDELL
jgi:hypothetical protein